MRTRQNPLRNTKSSCKHESITMGVTTHLPNREGYHKDRLDIVGLCLASMRQRSDLPFNLFVYDNGSCDDLTSLLSMCRRKGLIDVLVLSENVGKREAQRRLVDMAPGFIFGGSDDDMLFMQNWLAPQVDILARFPNVGVVTGMPTHVCFAWAVSANKKFAGRTGVTATFPDWPDEWKHDYIRSVGLRMPERKGGDPIVPWSLEEYNKRYNFTAVMLEYNGVRAWATSHHAQFTGYKEVLQPFICARDEHQDLNMSKVPYWFDGPIDKAGYLRLATPDLLVRHIGNEMDDTIKKLAEGVERWW